MLEASRASNGVAGASETSTAPQRRVASRHFVWTEPLDSLLYLATFGVLGTLLRGGLVHLFACYSTAVPGASCRTLDDGALFRSLAPNMLGCFVNGLLATPCGVGVSHDAHSGSGLACLPPSHRLQRCAQCDAYAPPYASSHMCCARLIRLHVGLRVGFCGSLTTWASWNQAMVERVVRGDWARGLIGYVVGAQCAAASLMLGHHAAASLWHLNAGVGCSAAEQDADGDMQEEANVDVLTGEPPPAPALSHPEAASLWREDVLCLAALLAALASCAATVGAAHAPSSRQICLAALFGPFGVILRWHLGRWNGALGAAPWLPAGTLAANTLGCVFDAAVSAAFWRNRLGRGEYWGSLLDGALQAGFAGALSTVSTVAAEAALLMGAPRTRWRGYAYLGATLAFGFAPAAAIYGGVTAR